MGNNLASAQPNPKPALYISATGTSMGRGVYAGLDFDAGQVVEIAPVVLLDLNTQPFPRQIRRMLYNWSETQVALALGYGSLYNHSDQPNLGFFREISKQIIIFRAVRKIEAGDQLTISYDYTGPGKNPRNKSWFEIHKVKKIDLDL